MVSAAGSGGVDDSQSRARRTKAVAAAPQHQYTSDDGPTLVTSTITSTALVLFVNLDATVLSCSLLAPPLPPPLLIILISSSSSFHEVVGMLIT